MTTPRPQGSFAHLNRGGEWSQFETRNLEVGDGGELTLETRLAFPGVRLADPGSLPFGGLAVLEDGRPVWTTAESAAEALDPATVWQLPDCAERPEPFPCADRIEPRAFPALAAFSRRLVFADPDGARLLLFGAGGDFRGIWRLPGRRPARIAASKRWLYVVDAAQDELLRLDADGRVDERFAERVRAASLTASLVAVHAAADGPSEVSVYDPQARAIRVFLENGVRRFDVPVTVRAPTALACTKDLWFLANPATGHVVQYSRDRAVEVEGWEGPVAALAWLDPDVLLLHSGGTGPPIRGRRGDAHARAGWLFGGPFELASAPVFLQRLQALGSVPAGTRVRLFAYPSEDPRSARPTAPAPQADAPFSGRWHPLDGADGFIGVEARLLWVGAVLEGDGREAPALQQLRIDFDRPSYSRHLPAIYRPSREDPCRARDGDLERLLALYQGAFRDLEERVDRLADDFDADAAASEALPWLASWLGVAVDERRPEPFQRETIRGAFEAHGRAGTAAGLRSAVRRQLGFDVRVDEPLAAASWWRLPAREPSPGEAALGFTTMLPGTEPDGSVLDASATLDRSDLVGDGHYGAPMFDELAHRVSVLAYPCQVPNPECLEELRGVVEAERPAHTRVEVCVVEPTLRIGFQARLGIDTLVGGAPTATPLGETTSWTLGGVPAGRIGGAALGEDSHIGSGAART